MDKIHRKGLRYMKAIGMIGGMSWESTVTYYQIVNEVIRREKGGYDEPEIKATKPEQSLRFCSVWFFL